MVNLSRGMRNNNPFNIVRSKSNWLGKMKPSKDKTFESFINLRYGLRAGLIVLRTYIRTYHFSSVRSIISRFAPESENNTEAYINYVETYLDHYECSPVGIQFRSDAFFVMCCAILKYESRYDCSIVYLKEICEHYNL